jgi:hypothetical protein
LGFGHEADIILGKITMFRSPKKYVGVIMMKIKEWTSVLGEAKSQTQRAVVVRRRKVIGKEIVYCSKYSTLQEYNDK